MAEEIRKIIKEQFGAEVELKFREGGKGKIYAYKYELPDFLRKHLIQSGIYFGRVERDGLRLSLDGCSLVKPERCFESIDDGKVLEWMRGEDIEVNSNCRFVILKWRGFSAGCGKVYRKGEKKFAKNFVPKNRRIDEKY